MKHALVVGGSGMLAKSSLWLAENGFTVSVIGRSRRKLSKLTEKSEKIIPITVDYYHEAEFQSEIRKSIAERGPFDLVVAWIHDHDEKIIGTIGQEINHYGKREWSLFHVLGSRANLEDILKQFNTIENCRYHQVQLGFVIEDGRSRWLTHDEISDGVIQCIRSDSKQYVAGTLTPWDKRPS